jgi:hypothetical protein
VECEWTSVDSPKSERSDDGKRGEMMGAETVLQCTAACCSVHTVPCGDSRLW